MPRFEYTALPLATLTLTAHTRPVSQPRGSVGGRSDTRPGSDTDGREDVASR